MKTNKAINQIRIESSLDNLHEKEPMREPCFIIPDRAHAVSLSRNCTYTLFASDGSSYSCRGDFKYIKRMITEKYLQWIEKNI